MPIYEYRCEKCGVFEETQRITDPSLDRCPTCRRKVRRLISNTSFQLKGGGWYVTDYARAAQKGGGKEAGTDGGSSSEAASDKSDTKTEAGSTKKPGAKAAAKAERKAAGAGT
jgi:putative FmdB family regulatory protein